ncbi:MAG: hypothetical protein K2M64_02055 [Clostridia bacterium]|nr:hypothetical protein [Clostridia bacterium]
MKRCLQTLAISLAFLTVTSIVGYVARFIPLDFWWIFGIATAILVVGLIFTIALWKRTAFKLVTVFINAVAMGFYLRSWYINRGFDNPLWLMLGISLLASVYMFVFMLPLYINAINRHYGVYLTLFTILSLIGYVCLVVLTKTTWVSTLGFFGLLELGFIMCMSIDAPNKHKLLQSWQYASYTVVLCAIIILVIVLSVTEGGDGLLDGLDFDVNGGGGGSIRSPRQTKTEEQIVDDLLPKN